MRLLEAWKGAVTFFYPHNFMFFAFVTVRAVLEIYWIMVRYWFLILPLVVGASQERASGIFFFISVLFYYLLILFIIIVTRPSVAQKNNTYYTDFLLVGLPVVVVFTMISFAGSYSLSFFYFYGSHWQVAFLLVEKLWYATQIFFLLLFLDSDHRYEQIVPSLLRSGKMIVYTFPIVFFFGVLILIVEIGFYFFIALFSFTWNKISILSHVMDVMATIDNAIVTRVAYKIMIEPFVLAIFANIYIKKLHEHFKLLF